MSYSISPENPRVPDVNALLEHHLAFASEVTPPGHVHALDVDALLGPDVTLFGARREGRLLAIGALRRLDETHAEIKSMHTSADARGQGLGKAMVKHLLSVARRRGFEWVSLETGTHDAFKPASDLYQRVGFVTCEPFAEHTRNSFSTCMTLPLDPQ